MAEPVSDGGVMARVAVLEAKVRLLSMFMRGLVVAFVSALIAYFFKGAS